MTYLVGFYIFHDNFIFVALFLFTAKIMLSLRLRVQNKREWTKNIRRCRNYPKSAIIATILFLKAFQITFQLLIFSKYSHRDENYSPLYFPDNVKIILPIMINKTFLFFTIKLQYLVINSFHYI